MNTRIYLRASTQEQDAERAKDSLVLFASEKDLTVVKIYTENASGTKLDRPELNRLLNDSNKDEVILIESVDRLSRLPMEDWDKLKQTIKDKGLKIVVADLPTTHAFLDSTDMTSSILNIINNMLLDLMATMARVDNEKRIERILQGQQRAREQGKKIGGSIKNQEIREKIKQYLDKNLNAKEIAKLANCGVATVYRVKKELA